MHQIQVFLRNSHNGRTEVADVDLHSGVDSIIKRAASTFALREGVRLKTARPGSYTTEVLTPNAGKLLNDYGIVDKHTLYLSCSLLGGYNPDEDLQSKKKTLEPLKGKIRMTKKPCMFGLETDPNKNRAQMPCGHVISPSAMTSFALRVLSRPGQPYRFFCPILSCGAEWEYVLIRHVACLSQAQKQQIEASISINLLAKMKGVHQCPGCSQFCYRSDPSNNIVRCNQCSSGGTAFDFCWACLRTWKSAQAALSCGNPGCDGQTPDTMPSDMSLDYRMKAKPRGICLIISNETFTPKPNHLGDRVGGHRDREAMSRVFPNLQFTPQIEINLTKQEMERCIATLAHEVDHSSYDCLVCCVSSHGSEDGVCGTDWGTVPIAAFMNPFKGLVCPTLSGKPKLFFVNACRGSVEQPEADEMEADSAPPRLPRQQMIPHDTDFLMAFSTTPGYVSWRNIINGSPFVIQLCQLLEQYASSEDLMTILTRLNNKVGGSPRGGFIQCPEQVYRLRKKLTF